MKAVVLATVGLVLLIVGSAKSENQNIENNLCNKSFWQTVSDNSITASLAKSANSLKIIEEISCEGDSLLHVAAKWGNAQSINWLIKNGFDPNRQTLSDHATPFSRAIFWGNIDTAKALYEFGADPDFETLIGTPLEQAFLFATPEQIKPFIQFLNDRGYKFKREHLAAAIKNRDPLMIAQAHSVGANINSIFSVFHPYADYANQKVQLTALEYAFIHAPNEKGIGFIFC